MNYIESRNHIDSLSKFGIKLGLDRLSFLLNKMGNPHKQLKFIHIAGTNGKGSISTMTSIALKNAGYKVGLYTSPSVICYRERIQINNKFISKEDFAECTTYVKSIIDSNHFDENPTQFEVECAVMFEYFKRKKCDIVCLEVGLGGRLDATNVIQSPLVQVLTSISFDHIDILGDNLTAIATEKCGIIKGNSTVSYPIQDSEALTVIRQICKNKNSQLIMPDLDKLKILDNSLFDCEFIYNNINFKKSLLGEYQIYNAITVYEICKELNKYNFKILDKNIKYAIENSTMPARMEILSKKPLIILDGAHNTQGLKSLKKSLKSLQNRKINILMGMLKDKDYKNSLSIICPLADNFYCVTPPNPRALKCDKLAEVAKDFCTNVQYFENLDDSLKIIDDLDNNDVLIVCGSLYLANEIRDKIINKVK